MSQTNTTSLDIKKNLKINFDNEDEFAKLEKKMLRATLALKVNKKLFKKNKIEKLNANQEMWSGLLTDDLIKIEKGFKNGASLRSTFNKQNPVLYAINKKNINILNFLKDKNIDINKINKNYAAWTYVAALKDLAYFKLLESEFNLKYFYVKENASNIYASNIYASNIYASNIYASNIYGSEPSLLFGYNICHTDNGALDDLYRDNYDLLNYLIEKTDFSEQCSSNSFELYFKAIFKKMIKENNDENFENFDKFIECLLKKNEFKKIFKDQNNINEFYWEIIRNDKTNFLFVFMKKFLLDIEINATSPNILFNKKIGPAKLDPIRVGVFYGSKNTVEFLFQIKKIKDVFIDNCKEITNENLCYLINNESIKSETIEHVLNNVDLKALSLRDASRKNILHYLFEHKDYRFRKKRNFRYIFKKDLDCLLNEKDMGGICPIDLIKSKGLAEFVNKLKIEKEKKVLNKTLIKINSKQKINNFM